PRPSCVFSSWQRRLPKKRSRGTRGDSVSHRERARSRAPGRSRRASSGSSSLQYRLLKARDRCNATNYALLRSKKRISFQLRFRRIQSLTQRLPGAEKARLHGTNAGSRDLRDLLVRESLHVLENHHQPIFAGQVLDGIQDLPAKVLLELLVLAGAQPEGGAGRQTLGKPCHLNRSLGPAALAQGIERLVPDEPRKPGLELAWLPEGAQGPVRLEKSLLNNVLGMVEIPENPKRDRASHAVVLSNQELEKLGFS